MTAKERQVVLDEFAAGEARLRGLVEGLKPEQWHFRESPERWTIAEIVEHLVTVERRVLANIQKNLASGASPVERIANPALDAGILAMIREPRGKIQAPEPARPTGKWTEPAVLMTEFRSARANSETFTRETDANLRAYGFPHVALGEIDCYQWLIVLAAHTHRHTGQIEAIGKHPEFPKGNTATAA